MAPKKKDSQEKSKVNFDEVIQRSSRNMKMNQSRGGISYTEIHMKSMRVDQVAPCFANYQFVTSVDLSSNLITDFTNLGLMQSLLHLNLENNSIKDMKPLSNEEAFLKLQTLNMSKNKITELLPIKCPKLTLLNLNSNAIDKIETFDGHPRLKVLSLRANKINALTQLTAMPALKELYLSENKIRQFTGLEGLGSLITLNLRKNFIDIFEESLPAFDNIQYLNFRENKIEKQEELYKLNQYSSSLKTLIFSCKSPVLTNSQHLPDQERCRQQDLPLPGAAGIP